MAILVGIHCWKEACRTVGKRVRDIVNNEEIEVALAICSATPGLVAAEIAELKAIGSYGLRPRPDMTLRDVYVDLADGALGAHKLGMRVRSVNNRRLLTLKGRAEAVAGGGKRREEIELEWSADALGLVRDRLADHGITLANTDFTDPRLDPLAALAQMGFVVQQTRVTTRRPRDVFGSEDTTGAIAELAVDSVAFEFSFGVVRFFEVEIEVKGAGGVEAMHDVSRELLSRWPETLRMWKHGKRSTGRAAEVLIGEWGKGELLNCEGVLSPEAYGQIDAYLIGAPRP